jgi:membrane protein DedA with SNARE-associated domain
MRRHGFVVVMFARFVWVLRQLNGVLAGALSMPMTRFVPANFIGAGLWVGAWSLGPYFFANWFGISTEIKTF